jgi:hypothetical protein
MTCNDGTLGWGANGVCWRPGGKLFSARPTQFGQELGGNWHVCNNSALAAKDLNRKTGSIDRDAFRSGGEDLAEELRVLPQQGPLDGIDNVDRAVGETDPWGARKRTVVGVARAAPAKRRASVRSTVSDGVPQLWCERVERVVFTCLAG